MKYRKKPVVIEAVRWMTDNANEIKSFIGEDFHFVNGSSLVIHTLEGHMMCNPFDWVIKGIKGEFYPCKPDIFEATYELADSPPVSLGERAVGFAEWLVHYYFVPKQDSPGRWIKQVGIVYQHGEYTTSELFSLYLTSTGQQSENKTERK